MARNLLDALGLFAVPFAVYALVLAVRQQYPFVAASWSRGLLAALTVAGLALVVLGLVAVALFADRHRGAYVPAHLDGGRLVPGHME